MQPFVANRWLFSQYLINRFSLPEIRGADRLTTDMLVQAAAEVSVTGTEVIAWSCRKRGEPLDFNNLPELPEGALALAAPEDITLKSWGSKAPTLLPEDLHYKVSQLPRSPAMNWWQSLTRRLQQYNAHNGSCPLLGSMCCPSQYPALSRTP